MYGIDNVNVVIDVYQYKAELTLYLAFMPELSVNSIAMRLKRKKDSCHAHYEVYTELWIFYFHNMKCLTHLDGMCQPDSPTSTGNSYHSSFLIKMFHL